MDPRYMAAAERYISKLADEIKPYLITNGGPSPDDADRE